MGIENDQQLEKDHAPCMSGCFLFFCCTYSVPQRLTTNTGLPRFSGGILKGRSGRPWRRLVALARRELPPVCHLCGGMIDMGLDHNDAMSWTLDHIRPLANGGSPEDLSNVAPAHRRCNSKKGANNSYNGNKIKRSRIW
jgi:5-methylcytosine-specific restriction endonuclease McrA